MTNNSVTMYAGFAGLMKERGIREAAEKAASLGFSSVEFLEIADGDGYSPLFRSIEHAAAARLVLEAHGLSVACYSVGVNLIDINAPEPCVIPRAIERLKYAAKCAEALGCKHLHHTVILSLKLPDGAPSYDEVFPLAVSAAGQVADFCLPLGITVLYEEQGMYFNGIEGFGKLFVAMKENHANVGVCGDVGNILFADEPLLPLFERFAKDIRHVHLKDYFVNKPTETARKHFSKGGNVITDAPFGTGDIDLPACLRVLKSVGYTGAFALEYTATGENEVQAVKTLLRDNFI